jgi:OmpA-OmpF porin, OOP family
MISKLAVLAAIVAFPWICYRCMTANGPAIQDLIQSKVSQVEAAASIAPVQVVADGRDVVLNGTVTSEDLRARAGALALAVPGVRTVDNRIVVVVPPSPAAVQERINQILLSKRIEFETNRDVLLPTSIPVLEEVRGVLSQAPQLSVTIEGHTDNQGDAASNRALSVARARAVTEWLSGHGVASSRLQSAGFGPDKPIAPNTTAAGRARNRRVDITAR